MTRAFGVSSSASHDAPTSRAATSFDSIRCRNAAASGPATRTNARGRRAAAISVVTATKLV
jgi:hypothetical protein